MGHLDKTRSWKHELAIVNWVKRWTIYLIFNMGNTPVLAPVFFESQRPWKIPSQVVWGRSRDLRNVNTVNCPAQTNTFVKTKQQER